MSTDSTSSVEPAAPRALGGPGAAGRFLLFVEVLVGLGVVTALIGRAYGVFPTLTFLLCAAAVAYTGWMGAQMIGSLGDPTLEVSGRVRDYAREKLEGEKRLLLQGIKDLEIDFATGKMARAEYLELRATAEARAIHIIGSLRESDERWAKEAERLVTKRLGAAAVGAGPVASPRALEAEPEAVGPPADRAPAPLSEARLFDDRPVQLRPDGPRLTCAACGFSNEADARFCAGCGRPRAKDT